MALPPELALVLYGARTALSADRADRMRRLARGPLDWDRVLAHARRHGLDPLLSRHASALGDAIPPPALAELRRHAEVTAVRNRLLTAELGKVLAQLAERGIGAMPYKGPVLAVLAYGDVALRRFADLDVLVRRPDVPGAVAALRGLGYAPRFNLTPAQERAYLASQCECPLDRDRGRLTVELHWDVAPRDFGFSFDVEGLWRRAQPATCAGLAVLMPALEDLLLALVVHGSKHLWERLSWLVDVSQLVEAHPEIDWTRLLERARERGGARMLAVALGLAELLLELRVPAAAGSEMARDRVAARLVRQIAGWVGDDAVPPHRSAAALRAYVGLRERMRDKACCALRTALTPTIEDWASLRLPAPLLPLHYALRPFRLAAKRAGLRPRPAGERERG